MASLADAYVRIRPDTSGLDAEGISKPASEMGKKAGEVAGKQFGLSFSSLLKTASVAAAGIATGQIASFFKSTIEAASDVSEAQNKVAVVFGASTKSVLDFGKTSATSLGLSKASYLDAVGTLGNLFVALKLPGPEAAKMSTNMVKLAGDLASFNNTSPEAALEALRSGLVGETEPLRTYGVNINAATLATEAMKLGMIKNVKDALTPAQKAQATYALVLDQTKTAQGDFARTSGGLANQQRILKAQFDDLKSTIGAALLPAFTNLVHIVTGQVVPGIKEFIAGMQGKGPIDGFAGGLNTAGLALRAFFDAMKSGDVTSNGLVGAFERAGVAVRQIGQDLAAFGGFLLNNKAAIITFVAVLGTAKAVIEAITIATRAWAAIQAAIAFIQLASQVRSLSEAWLLLDAAMDANPIGIVVIALAAIAAGLVYAYTHSETFRNIVNGAFEGVKTVALSLWHGVFEPFWHGIVAVFDAIVVAAKGWWTGVEIEFNLARAGVSAVISFFQILWTGITAVFNGIVAAAKGWWAGLVATFDLIKAAVTALAQPFLWLWHNVYEPVFSALGTIIKNFYIIFKDIIILIVDVIRITLGAALTGLQTLWSAVWNAIKTATSTIWNAIKAIWDALVSYLSGPFHAALNAIQATWNTIWNAIKAVAQAWWTGIKNIWDLLVQYLGGPFSSALRTIESVWNTIWNGIKTTITNVWNFIRDSIFTPMSNFITRTVPDAFRTGVDAVGRFWNALQDKVKQPINFVIGFINRGIIGPINGLVGTFGGTRLTELSQLASGGMVHGPGTGTSDSILGLSAGGVPTARVSNGEFVVNAAQTQKHIGLLHAINTPGFAGGGLIGTITGGIGDALNALSNPISWLLGKAGDLGNLVGDLGNNGFAHMLAGIPRKLIDWAAAWLKEKFSSLLSAGGGPASLGGPGGNSVAAILAVARMFDPTAQVSSGYRPGAADYHGAGLAADIIGSNMDGIAAGFYAMSGRLLELIHSPSWFVKNGVRVGPDFYASVFAEHFNHVHVAAYANALGFANGGVINEPIWGVGKSGRQYTFGENGPETIIPGTSGGAGGGVNLTIHVHGDVGDRQVAAIRTHVDDAFGRLLTQIRTGRRR